LSEIKQAKDTAAAEEEQRARKMQGLGIWTSTPEFHNDDYKYNETILRNLIVAPFQNEISGNDVVIEGVHIKESKVEIKIRCEKLKQNHQVIRALKAQMEKEMTVEFSFKSCSEEIKKILHYFDQAEVRGTMKRELMISSSLDEVVKDPTRLRVVLVCMDSQISSDNEALREFKMAVEANVVIIPIILPDYVFRNKVLCLLRVQVFLFYFPFSSCFNTFLCFFKVRNGIETKEKDFGNWWPENMSEMQHHCLFFAWKGITDGKIKSELLPVINKYLSEWRGKAPGPHDFWRTLDIITCAKCVDALVETPAKFSRKVCERELQDWVTRQNENSKAEVLDAVTVEENVEQEDIQDPQIEASKPQFKTPVLSCDNGHTMEVENILSKAVIYHSIPCPQCVQHFEMPPFCFNRDECLLRTSEGSWDCARVGTMTCQYCRNANREERIRIIDIVVPEVFISYNWGQYDEVKKNWSTQAWVEPIKKRVEQRTDLICWFDVKGGMSAGQSHLDVMQEGIKRCSVVIMFLSDAYCNSENWYYNII
jgi:hypothetical protein